MENYRHIPKTCQPQETVRTRNRILHTSSAPIPKRDDCDQSEASTEGLTSRSSKLLQSIPAPFGASAPQGRWSLLSRPLWHKDISGFNGAFPIKHAITVSTHPDLKRCRSRQRSSYNPDREHFHSVWWADRPYKYDRENRRSDARRVTFTSGRLLLPFFSLPKTCCGGCYPRRLQCPKCLSLSFVRFCPTPEVTRRYNANVIDAERDH